MSLAIKKKTEILVPLQSFPSVGDTGISKDSFEYGLRIGQAIQYEWFRPEGGTCRFYSQQAEFHRRRLYARAQQPVAKYKSQLTTNGDMSYLNLDFTPISIIPKFVDIIVNGMADRGLSVKAFSQDVVSAERKSRHQDMIEADMVSKDFLKATQEQFGVDAFNVDPDKLPEDSEELALYMNLDYKPGIEIAAETAIDTVFLENQFQDTETRIDKDVVEVGLGVGKHEFLKGNGITLSYVDPANFVYSYTEDPYFKDWFYNGEAKPVHINELVKINPDLTEAQLDEIRQYSSSWGPFYPNVNLYGLFQKDIVWLLYFNYKTRKDIVYKRKKTVSGGQRAIRKDDSFAYVKDNDLFEKSSIPRDVWYEGIMVLGSNILLKWETAKNMPRESTTQHVRSNYVACAPRIYKGMVESHVERMIPFADQIQLNHLKLQQIKARMLPDGVFIDVDGISEVDLGGAGAYNPEDALNLFFQTGSIIGRSFTQEGDFNNARIPIQELTKSSAQGKVQTLIADYNHQLNMLRDVTGLNEASDGSTPDPKSLVGLQKMAALNSNTATRHILNAKIYIKRSLAECISIRVADVLQYSDMKEEFAMKIGKFNVEILEDIKNLYLYNFGIFIELAPDAEEKQALENNIQISLQEGSINLEDAIDIRMIRNLKLANEMLKVKRRKREKEKQEREDVQMQMQAQINAEAQQSAADAAVLKINAEAQAKISVEEAKSRYLIESETATAQLKSQLMDQEFRYSMRLKGLEVDGQMAKINKVEDRKDERINLQSSRQSALIEQRQKDLPATDFESNNDNMAEFDLSDFEPR
jgi:hypothetical protein